MIVPLSVLKREHLIDISNQIGNRNGHRLDEQQLIAGLQQEGIYYVEKLPNNRYATLTKEKLVWAPRN